MADAISSDRSLLGSTSSGFTYGRASRPRKRGLLIALGVITVMIAGIIVVIFMAGHTTDANTPTPSPGSYLLHRSHIPLEYVRRISTFRSSVGGSWPGVDSPFNHNKTCGSMKHWFDMWTNVTQVTVYSPLNGTITGVSYSLGTNDLYGFDIRIQGTTGDGQSYIVQIGHVNITDHDAIADDKTVFVGTPLGDHIANFVNSDISVLNQTASFGEYVSLFKVIDHETLTQFRRNNITNRTYPIISDRERKIFPLNCTQNHKIKNDSNSQKLRNWVYLNTTTKQLNKVGGNL
eukprot:660752_1